MTDNAFCKCAHSKEDHKLTAEFLRGPKVLPGIIMNKTYLELKIKITKC